jgi:hypothetical protein
VREQLNRRPSCWERTTTKKKQIVVDETEQLNNLLGVLQLEGYRLLLLLLLLLLLC